jgi:hypothetical protein
MIQIYAGSGFALRALCFWLLSVQFPLPMKKLLPLLGLSALLLTGLFAQTAEERASAVAYLEKTKAGVVAAAKGLSDAQLNFKVAPEKWSVAQVLEHIASAEDMLFGMVTDQVMKAPARTEADDVKAIDQLILTAIPDRTQKRSAPEPLIPTDRFHGAKASLEHFTAARDQTVAFLKATKDLRDHASDGPLGKKQDAYQWILFIAAHSERHTKQMLEVKADPNFPKS